tara:strand:- start:164 stop:421 length:258 start_codon:yes stop_codon:yes gene_type:complete
MDELTTDEISKIYTNSLDSVSLINSETEKKANETEDDWKDRIKRNVQHLENIKLRKKIDNITSIWTTEDFTSIDAAIITGKKVYE